MSNPRKRWRFPKSARLLERRDYLMVYDQGECRTDRRLWIYFLDRGDGAPARAGITIPRKAGKAVRRNRTRRRLREIIRHLQPRLRPGINFVINCSPQAVELEFSELQTRVANLLAAARLLAHEPSEVNPEKP